MACKSPAPDVTKPVIKILGCCKRQRLAETLEDRAAQCVLRKSPFRVPLYAQEKILCSGHRHRLDLAIGGSRFDRKLWRQPIHTLMVQGIDHCHAETGETREEPAGRKRDGMGRRIFGIARGRILRLAMIEPSG